jgi:hypothetical protein
LSIANHELQFRQWLGEHKGLLVKVVRSFAQGPADQDDLFQEILMQVWLSLPNFRENSRPTTMKALGNAMGLDVDKSKMTEADAQRLRDAFLDREITKVLNQR